MLEQVLGFVTVGKYIVIALAIVGAIMLVMGMHKGNKDKITRGGYMLLLAIVLWVSAYFLISVSKERGQQKMYEIQQQYGY